MYAKAVTRKNKLLLSTSRESIQPGGVSIITIHFDPPKTECGSLHGGVIENGRARNPLTLCSVPVLYVQVWVHIPGDLQSAQQQQQLFTLYRLGQRYTTQPRRQQKRRVQGLHVCSFWELSQQVNLPSQTTTMGCRKTRKRASKQESKQARLELDSRKAADLIAVRQRRPVEFLAECLHRLFHIPHHPVLSDLRSYKVNTYVSGQC